MNSPTETDAAWPTTVTSSRRPRAWTRSTEKPFSSLWKVTRSTVPARWSDDEAGGLEQARLLRVPKGPRATVVIARLHE